jgi:hypothetical protein
MQLERAAAELEERNRQVERMNRMKTEFLSRMSHELRTPLNAIVGYSELLSEQPAGPLPPPYPRFVANIQEGARHLLAMVNDLLDISRIEAGRVDLNREAFRAADVMEEVLSVIAPLSTIKHIAIENQIPGGMSIRADRTRFKQVLYNLVSNAVKFTPEKWDCMRGPSSWKAPWVRAAASSSGWARTAWRFRRPRRRSALFCGARLYPARRLVTGAGRAVWAGCQPAAGRKPAPQSGKSSWSAGSAVRHGLAGRRLGTRFLRIPSNQLSRWRFQRQPGHDIGFTMRNAIRTAVGG